jgi:cell division septation protein DedD
MVAAVGRSSSEEIQGCMEDSMYCFTRSAVRQAMSPSTLIVLAAALVSAPAGAQTYRTALGVTGGWSTAGDLTPGLGFETVFEDGWTAGAQLETWVARVGMRVNASYAARETEGSDRPFRIAAADIGVMVRPLPVQPDRVIAPFIAVGAGPVLYMADGDGEPVGDGSYGDDPVLRFMVAPSAGVDLLTGSTVGLRVEVVDQIVFPSIGESPESEGVPRVHNPGVRAAVQFRISRPGRPVVVRAPDPTPAPAPHTQPEARPDPEPRPAQPAPQPAPPPAAPPAPVSQEVGIVYTVQVGSFAQESTARSWARRLERSGLPSWFVEIRDQGQRMIRLRVGAVDSLEDAQLLASRLREAFAYETWIDAVAPDEAVPADAIVATLRFLFAP